MNYPYSFSDVHIRSTDTPAQNADFELLDNVYVNNTAETWEHSGHYPVLYPRSLRGTVNAVKYALKHKLNIRAMGAKHSFSLCTQTEDVYISLSKTVPYTIEEHNQKVRDLDMRPLLCLKNAYNKKNYFHALGGMSLAMINHILCPDSTRQIHRFGRKRLFNMPGVDAMTIAGAIATGTHGSGGAISTLHDTVRSIQLVSGDGTAFRIEPRQGITDPGKHLQWHRDHPDEVKVKLIQNDDMFYSCLVNMGCFGIIYAVILEVEDMTMLHQETVYHKAGWKDFAAEKLSQPILPKIDEEEYYLSLLVNPYIKKGAAGQSIQTKISKPYDGKEESKRAKKRRWLPSLSANIGIVGRLIRFVANVGKRPKVGIIESALKSQHDAADKGKGYTDLSYKVLNGGLEKLKRYGTAIEFCFPTPQVPAVMDKVIALLEEVGDSGKGYYLNAPISIRFVRPSKAFLAHNFELGPDGSAVKEWCYIELIRVNGKHKDDDEREALLFQRLQDLLDEEGGRPHWGLNFEFGFSVPKLQELYPKFDTWLK
jgi:hypothetical protein